MSTLTTTPTQNPRGKLAPGNQDYSLSSRYTLEEGMVLLSGIQALVRLPMDQHRADARRGLNVATLISGYRGSPLAGYDLTLLSARELLKQHNIVFIPGVNEDLGATAVFGSQIANLYPNPKYDGVVGIWYGKAPGVDRSGDIFKHANFAGTGRNGGVLALTGDDPECKSSTLPSHSEAAFFDALMPVLYPGTIQEVLDFGRLGLEMSRFSGLWVGFKVATDIADGFGSANVSPDRLQVVIPEFKVNGQPWAPKQNATLVAPFSLELERQLHEGRLEAARVFGAANKFNVITVPTPQAWLGIAAPGKTYYDLREALAQIGLRDDEALRQHGIRLLKIGMLFPMDPGVVREFADGLEQILVIEEKRPSVEDALRNILYGMANPPRIAGKKTETGETLVAPWGALDADKIAQVLPPYLRKRFPENGLTPRPGAGQAAPSAKLPLSQMRVPFFCSGCPHNSSTNVPEGSMASGGIGCHGMALRLEDRRTTGITHMGGEGAQWVGMSPFSGVPHIFQNIGDGTFFHSGSLAVRQAVAAGTNITYKILYNAAVGMTGGQKVDGEIGVPELTRMLEAEGVKRIIVTSDEPEKYAPDARWAPGVEVWDRTRLDEAQRVLRVIPGTTVLIHDQTCAAELRRLRKRGKIADRKTRVWINELVCEGCGDCGVKSNCLSVQPVETEFGRKTQIHQSSCNKDYSCLQGDCPSFVTFEPKKEAASPKASKKKIFEVREEIPEPAGPAKSQANIFMVGVGGTGVVTVNQLVGTAALLEGKFVSGLDQTGLSQKAGPVSSHVKIFSEPPQESSKVSGGSTDCFLAFDLIAACSGDSLNRLDSQRTVALVSTSHQPTGTMVRSVSVPFPDTAPLLDILRQRTQGEKLVALDAVGLAESLFGDHMMANIILLGAAYQVGALPVSAEAVEKAIILNGVGVDANINAFRVGRLAIVDPARLPAREKETTAQSKLTPAPVSAEARKIIDAIQPTPELRRLLEIRVPELIAYQNTAYACQYVDFVQKVSAAEEKATPGTTTLREAVARYLFKLMAYKDEYEVGRLHLKSRVTQSEALQVPGGLRYRYQLHPPILRAMGMKKKIEFGAWFEGAFGLLARLKFLRGTKLDVFGYAEVRRVERALIDEYRAMIDQQLASLSPATHARAVQIASLPDMIRGYEDVKLGNVKRFREQVKALA